MRFLRNLFAALVLLVLLAGVVGVAAVLSGRSGQLLAWVRPAEPFADLSWTMLSEFDYDYVTYGPGRTIITRKLNPALQALDGKRVRIEGFVFPLQGGERQTRFLLSGLPPDCPFCLPGGASELIEVQCEPSASVPFGYETVMMEGRLHLLDEDESGLLYRLTEARPATG